MFSSERQPRAHWIPLAEAVAVLCLILLHIWHVRFVYPAFAWWILALVIGSHFLRGEGAADLGFRWTNFRACVADYLPFAALLALMTITAGIAARSIREIRWDTATANLVGYCLWGLFQQYVLNGYFVNRLAEFYDHPGASNQVATLAAIFFAMAHQPNWFLVAVTFAGGYLAAKAYLRYRNLYFLGLVHALLGFAIYLAVPDSISHHMYVGPRWFDTY